MRISDWSSDVCSSDLHDRISQGNASLRVGGVLHHIGLGRHLHGTPVIMLINDLAIRVINATTGEIIRQQIGRASCRERECQYVYISVVTVSLKKKQKKVNTQTTNQTQIHRAQT